MYTSWAMTPFKPFLFICLVVFSHLPLQSWGQSRNPYDVLGIPRNSTLTEVKKAYRQLAMKYHPDHHSEQEESIHRAQFQEVKEAFEKLTGGTKGSATSTTPSRNAQEAIQQLQNARTSEERIQAFRSMGENAEDIAVIPKLREQADEVVLGWIGDGSQLQMSELAEYYRFLGKVDFLIFNLVDQSTYYEVPFLYDDVILDSLARRKDFGLDDLIRLISQSGELARDRFGFEYGAVYKFKPSSGEALLRFGIQKNLIHSIEDLEKFSVKIKSIYSDGNRALFADMNRYLSRYFHLILEMTPKIKAGDFERLKYVLPYHQNLILLEEALRENVFKEAWQILYAIGQVQTAQETVVGDDKPLGINPRHPPTQRSKDPVILKKNKERRGLLFKAASSKLKELGATAEDARKLASLLKIGAVNRSLIGLASPFRSFQWPARDYDSANLWPQAVFKGLMPSGLLSIQGQCFKVHGK